MARLRSLIKEKGREGIDLHAFQDIYSRIFSKEALQTNKELFALLSKQKQSIDADTLKGLADLVGWPGETKDLIPTISTNESALNLEDFTRLLNSQCAL